MGRSAPPQLTDAVLPGRLAELLADHGEAGLTEALDMLVEELGLRSAVLRDAGLRVEPMPAHPGSRLRAVAGDAAQAVNAVPTMRVVPAGDAAATVELPVRAGGRDVGVLTVLGARPSQLPVLRTVAAVLALALSRPGRVAGSDAATDLIGAADADADAVADRLHDGPVQALVVAHYAAEAATRGGDPVAARDAVKAALVELRRALWHLRPRGDGGLSAALGALSARLEEAGLRPLGFVLDEVLAEALPPAVASTAYRLVQALALTESAGPVRVALRREGASVVLDVEGGAPLEDVARWADKARALGGSLTATEARTRLTVPLTAPSTQRTKATS
jgi:hypothetical protein